MVDKYRPETKDWTDCESAQDFAMSLADMAIASQFKTKEGKEVVRVHLRTSPRKNSFSLSLESLTPEKAAAIGEAVGLFLGAVAKGECGDLISSKLKNFEAWSSKRTK